MSGWNEMNAMSQWRRRSRRRLPVHPRENLAFQFIEPKKRLKRRGIPEQQWTILLGNFEAKSDSDGFVKVVDFDSLPLNYHDEENEEELVGDKIFHKYEKIDKETDDITGDTILSEREVIEEDDDDFPERRVIEPLHWQQ
ncbi:uncharacterized protein LOC121271771 isoform X2 [Carcharodon carcharias]|uniref:uncharacterized protein LOC121271771 isoform X2 n=1 Tax=Carcharodon carcharias TaxID=13397 RepID=UPI001B7ED3DA|nr:uncharacterized protein LOC121271771 isoform X2 [Carcharodon carcharias]